MLYKCYAVVEIIWQYYVEVIIMNKATRRKLDEIVKLIENGTTKKDILSKKFNRVKSKMTAWINNLSSELTPKEKELLSFGKYEIVEQPKKINIGIPVETLEILEQHEKRLRDLELKLKNQNSNDDVCSMDMLHIGDDILKLKSVVKSIRINTDLTDQLNIIAEKHRNYSKTNLWNKMLSEFIEKYK